MTASPILAWPLPAASDAPDGPAQMLALATAAEKYAVMRFASTIARDAAIPAPVNGMVCLTTDYGILWRRTASAWVVANVPAFASTAARDTAIPAPTAGIKCVIGTGTAMAEYVYTGTAWKLTWEDTGWVTTGITITPSADVTVNSYALRRVGNRVEGVVRIVCSAAITIAADGNAANKALFTLPADWGVPSSDQTMFTATQNDCPKLICIVTGGIATAVGGIPNLVTSTTTPILVYISGVRG